MQLVWCVEIEFNEAMINITATVAYLRERLMGKGLKILSED